MRKRNNPIGIIHKFFFKAPEILIKPTYDEKVDIWSLGVIAFESYMGNLPFEASNEREYMAMYNPNNPLRVP